MNLNQGKRNKQAVQVLNKVEYDSEGNPIGMMEDPSNPASANFGTPREPRRGGCYLGNGSAYITITGLLSTDTVEVLEESDMPTISNGRLDIASGNIVFGVKIFRAGELWAKYNCSENSGDICYDSSGNGNHGTIINAITTTPEENPNSIHQYQDVYSFENEEGYNPLYYARGVPDQFRILGIYGYMGNLRFHSFDSTSLGNLGKVGGVYSDEFGEYLYIVDALRVEPTNALYPKGCRLFFRWYSENPIFIRLMENHSDPDSLYQKIRSYCNARGISTISPNNINDYYLLADQPDKDELNLIFTLRDVASWESFYSSLPATWKPSTVTAWRPTINFPLNSYSNELQTIDIPKYVNSDLSQFSYIKILGGLKSYTDGGITNAQDESKLYEFYVYEYGEATYIPKNSSIQLPPFKDVLGNNLQYVGKVPGKAKFVGSSCFLADGNAYLSGGVLTTDTITAHPESEVPVCTIDGRLDFPVVNGKYFDITIERGGSVIARLPLCEPIIDPSNHIYHDVSGNGNHATLVNGTLANNGKQDKFHYLQRGLIKRDTGELIPILDDESGFVDGSLLDDVDAIPQDSHSFLNTGTELEAYDYPALKQADKNDDFWNEDDGLGTVTPKSVQFDSLITQKGLSDKLFLDSSVSETIKNVRMYGSDLKGRQLNTENKLTNNV